MTSEPQPSFGKPGHPMAFPNSRDNSVTAIRALDKSAEHRIAEQPTDDDDDDKIEETCGRQEEAQGEGDEGADERLSRLSVRSSTVGSQYRGKLPTFFRLFPTQLLRKLQSIQKSCVESEMPFASDAVWIFFGKRKVKK